MPKTEPPPIERLKLKDLVIDLRYSGRTQREIDDNAKDKAKELAAAGGWSPTKPGEYFVGEDGKRYLLAGFSRVAACALNGDKEGYFVQSNGDEIDHLLACETSNSVRPLSKLARGTRYLELMRGAVADDFAGTIAKDPVDFKRQPLTKEEIADRIGKSKEWVRQCIATAEAPEEIRELLENDRIAATVFEKACALANKHHDGSDAKKIAMCKRALRYANEQDKERATEKHFDEIKGEFIPEKKLIAEDGSEGSRDTAPATKKRKGAPVEPTELPNIEETPEPALFAPEALQDGTKENKKVHSALVTFFLDTEALEKIGVTFTSTDDEAEILATEVLKIIANLSQPI